MKVLYLGLSNRIRGIAETLSARSEKFHFLKPGEVTSRSFIIKQILDTEPVDIIVAAEAVRDQIPQAATLIKSIRDEGRTYPVLGLTNQYTEQTLLELFKAGANAILPFRVLRDGAFSAGGDILWNQVEALATLSKSPPKAAVGTALPTKSSNDLVQTGISFDGFSSDEMGNIRLHGRELSLTTLSAKVLEVFLRHGKKTVTARLIRENAYEKDAPPTDDTIKKAVFFLHQRLRGNLTQIGHPFKFPIIEWDGKEGWRFNLSSLRRLKDILAPEPAAIAPSSSIPGEAVLTYRGDRTMTTKFGFSVGENASKLYYGSHELTMPERQIKLFSALLDAEGTLVSRQALRDKCFPKDYDINDNALGQYVDRLGKSLVTELDRIGLRAGYPLIETIKGQGWAAHGNNLRRLYVAASDKGMSFAREAPFVDDIISAMSDLKTYHDFTVNPAKPTVYFRGELLRLPRRSAQVFSTLLEAGGDTVSRAKLYAACYPKGSNASEHAVSAAVSRTSKNLSDELRRVSTSFDFPLIENSKLDGWSISKDNLIRLQAMRPIQFYLNLPKVPLLPLLPG